MTSDRHASDLRRSESLSHVPVKTAVQRALGTRRCALSVCAGVFTVGLAAGLQAVTPVALFPAVFPLASLLPENGGDGSAGFVLTGIAAYDWTGGAVSAAGDINGDGIGDLIIGAIGAGPGYTGSTYVVFGRDTPQAGNFPAVFPLANLPSGDGSEGFVLTGVDRDDELGWSLSGAGDVNGDGIDDLIVSAGLSDRPYESYVVFGRDTALVGNFPAVFPLADLESGDGSEGFVLTGANQAVSAAGDVNGDGIDDVILGNFAAAPGGRNLAGESYVVFGRDTTLVGNFPAVYALASLRDGDGSEGFVIAGILEDDRSGYSVSGAGDVNGDGIGDVIIGAYNASPGGRFSAGESFVVFGRDTAHDGNFPAVFPLASLLPGHGDGSTGFVLVGIGEFNESGRSVSAAGDINGDGIGDLIIGAPLALRRGQSYVVFGRDTAQVGNFPPVFALASLVPSGGGGDGSAGFVLNGLREDDGTSIVSDAGDVNGDGIGDLIVGAIGADPGGRNFAGASYVVLGRDAAQGGSFPAEFELSSLLPGGGGDGTAGFVLNGIDSSDFSGSVSNAGDVNGDGIGDVIIGASGADPGDDYDYAGESYVVFGRSTAAAR
jgi:glycosylphosphatidylinositol phospholipase D